MIKKKFNDEWIVSEKQGTFGMAVDAGTKKVTLPYDAMIHTKRNPNAVGSYMTAFFNKGVWEYKKKFIVTEELKGKKLILQFDGVFEKAFIYVNGAFAGSQMYGYSQFFVDITPYVYSEGENEIKVSVRLNDSARWYTGAGIYRDVYLLASEMVHIVPQGIKMTTALDKETAAVDAAVTVKNEGINDIETLHIHTQISDTNGNLTAEGTSKLTVFKGQEETLHQKLYIENPHLWSDLDPELYTCRVLISYDKEGQNVVDTGSEIFGIRSLSVTPQHGLQVNGKSVYLRGACIHHDNGPLGAVSTDCIEERRVRKLKEAGFNAIRTAHNPASPALLRACDKYGIYVMEESFDAWTVNKCNYDYALEFGKYWEDDITALINKSYNHPSVIMYSIGNEIPDTGYPSGAQRSRKIANKVKSLDSTRFTINAINGMVSVMEIMTKMYENSMEQASHQGEGQEVINNMMTGLRDSMKGVMMLDAVTNATEEAFSCVDIAGYNYMDSRYEMDGKLFPNRVILGTETFPADIDQNWDKVKRLSYVIGDFCWTGWDYMGEAGIGLHKYSPVPAEYGTNAPWPCLTSMAGDISICGFRRPISYYREIVWGLRKAPYIAVKRPEHYGEQVMDSPWCWSDSVGSWTWNGYEGKSVEIEVYSNAEEIELLLNGKSLGRKKVGVEDRYKVVFDAIYEPGQLCARAYIGGDVSGTYEIETEEGTSLEAEKDIIHENELAFVWVSHPGISKRVKVCVEGGTVIALGNDDPLTEENFFDDERTTYDGRVLAVIMPDGAGEMKVECEAEAITVKVLKKEKNESGYFIGGK